MPPPIQPAPECRLRPPPRRPSRLVRRRARAPPAPLATDVYRLRGRGRSFVSPDALLASGAAPDVLPLDGPRSSQVLTPSTVLWGVSPPTKRSISASWRSAFTAGALTAPRRRGGRPRPGSITVLPARVEPASGSWASSWLFGASVLSEGPSCT